MLQRKKEKGYFQLLFGTVDPEQHQSHRTDKMELDHIVG
jgi:hypothetical protein